MRAERISVLAAFLKFCLASGLRGSSRLTFLLARKFKSLQEVPVQIADWSTLYIDLRMENSHALLVNAPYIKPFRELDEIRIMERFVRVSDVAFDIGANIGLHSILLSRLIGPQGRLFAFEPNPELIPALKRTISELGNATLEELALSDKNSESLLFVPPDDSMGSLADWTKDAEVGNSHTVSCREYRIDDLIEKGRLPQPNFIKCDVEGAELLVFRGARQTLERPDAPLIMFEINKPASSAFGFAATAAVDFLAVLKNPNYRFFDVISGLSLQPTDMNDSFRNVLAVPLARISFWPELQNLPVTC